MCSEIKKLLCAHTCSVTSLEEVTQLDPIDLMSKWRPLIQVGLLIQHLGGSELTSVSHIHVLSTA